MDGCYGHIHCPEVLVDHFGTLMHVGCGYFFFELLNGGVERDYTRQMEKHRFHNHVYPHAETDAFGYRLGIDCVEPGFFVGNFPAQSGG